jgi:hypothetical protein
MDRKRKANNGNGGSSKKLRFGNINEVPTSNAWRAWQEANRELRRSQRENITARRAAGTLPPRVIRTNNQVSANTRGLTNRIALLDQLSSMSNANLLARLQAPNRNNVERMIAQDNAPLLRRIRQLQGNNNEVRKVDLLILLRRANNTNLKRLLQMSNQSTLAKLNHVLRRYNTNLLFKARGIMGQLLAERRRT